MQEFLTAKKNLTVESAQTIDGERRRCNTMLGLKQSELESLRENLAHKTKMCDEYRIRGDILALWSGEGKTLARIRALQLKCFLALKQYRGFKKHSRQVLEHKLKAYKQKKSRQVFQAWQAQYREWKIEKNKEDFEKQVKLEIQSIAANYSKEIETLR